MMTREQMITKIVRYIGHAFDSRYRDPHAAISEYAARLTDEQLKSLVRLSGIAAKDRGNLSFVFEAVTSKPPALKMMLDNVALITEKTDFQDMFDTLQVMLSCGRDIKADPDHWAAHSAAFRTYDPIDMEDHWTYGRNKELVALIDANPKDADTILHLRETFKLRTVTQELLNEHRSTHAAVSHGWL